jgi:hypothetical protein
MKMNNANKENNQYVLRNITPSDLHKVVEEDYFKFVVELEPDAPEEMIDQIIDEVIDMRSNTEIAERYDLAQVCNEKLEWLIDEMPFTRLMNALLR